MGPLSSPDVGVRCESPQTLTYAWTPPILLSACAPAAVDCSDGPHHHEKFGWVDLKGSNAFSLLCPRILSQSVYSPADRGFITLLLCAVTFLHTCHGVYGQHLPWSRYAEVDHPSQAHTANRFSPAVSSPSHPQSRQDSCPPQSSELPDSRLFSLRWNEMASRHGYDLL